ncbi:hypothetical protein [Phenylobacterium immobile]|uniref:hypothetical protein n=1 Tax=Phenylobacterium immobile TaxID=21 RepID=UPI000A549741|nr:hypothetical protein [Phenylobacterium immobile]
MRGRVEAIEGGALRGWAWDPARPTERLRVRVRVADAVIGEAIAEAPRGDLLRAGIGDGGHGFRLALPSQIQDGGLQAFLLEAKTADGGFAHVHRARLVAPALAAPTEIATPETAATLRRAMPPVAAPLIDPALVRGLSIEVGDQGVFAEVIAPAAELGLLVYERDTLLGAATLRASNAVEDEAGAYRLQFHFDLPLQSRDGGFHAFNLRMPGSDRVILDAIPIALPAGRAKLAKAPPARPQYLMQPEALARLSSGPWEPLAGRNLSPAPRERYIEALRAESRWFEAHQDHWNVTVGLVLTPAVEHDAGWTDSERMWALQTRPGAVVLALGASAATLDPGSEAIAVSASDDLRSRLASLDWCVFGAAGDLLHPSVSATLIQGGRTADCVVWSLLVASGDVAGEADLHRRPEIDPHTLRHNPSIDTTFAVRASCLADCPDLVLEALLHGHIHPLLFWLSTRPGLRWQTRLEAHTGRLRAPDAGPRFERTGRPAPIEVYAAMESSVTEAFDLRESTAHFPTPFVLVPKARAGLTSVVIGGLGVETTTVLKCLHNLSRQRVTGLIEPVLVCEGEDAAPEIVALARRLFVGVEVRTAVVARGAYGRSRVWNAGAAQSTGEVLVFMNPAVRLRDGVALEQFGAWALRPDIATVGCGIHASGGGSSVYGYSGAAPADSGPVLQGQQDQKFAASLRQCLGNVGDLFAVSRETWLGMGGMDAERFAHSQGDVEFMLRARRRGLIHLYLGQLSAEIDGAGVVHSENLFEIAELRRLYPEATQESQYDLRTDPVGVRALEESFGDSAELSPLEVAAASRIGAAEDSRRELIAQIARALKSKNDLEAAVVRP